MKNVMQCVATMATYFLGPSERRTTPCTLVALVISLTVIAFSLQSPSREAHDKADGGSTRDVHESELLVAHWGRSKTCPPLGVSVGRFDCVSGLLDTPSHLIRTHDSLLPLGESEGAWCRNYTA